MRKTDSPPVKNYLVLCLQSIVPKTRIGDASYVTTKLLGNKVAWHTGSLQARCWTSASTDSRFLSFLLSECPTGWFQPDRWHLSWQHKRTRTSGDIISNWLITVACPAHGHCLTSLTQIVLFESWSCYVLSLLHDTLLPGTLARESLGRGHFATADVYEYELWWDLAMVDLDKMHTCTSVTGVQCNTMRLFQELSVRRYPVQRQAT